MFCGVLRCFAVFCVFLRVLCGCFVVFCECFFEKQCFAVFCGCFAKCVGHVLRVFYCRHFLSERKVNSTVLRCMLHKAYFVRLVRFVYFWSVLCCFVKNAKNTRTKHETPPNTTKHRKTPQNTVFWKTSTQIHILKHKTTAKHHKTPQPQHYRSFCLKKHLKFIRVRVNLGIAPRLRGYGYVTAWPPLPCPCYVTPLRGYVTPSVIYAYCALCTFATQV